MARRKTAILPFFLEANGRQIFELRPAQDARRAYPGRGGALLSEPVSELLADLRVMIAIGETVILLTLSLSIAIEI